MASENKKTEEETLGLEGISITREQALKHPLFKLYTEFWESPWGKETIKKSRERERDVDFGRVAEESS